MYIIAGLGNPGKQYAHTRHNVGFDTLDILEENYHIPIEGKKFKALYGQGYLNAIRRAGAVRQKDNVLLT